MTAEVIELRPGLKRLPPAPDSLRERAKDRARDAAEVLRESFARSPVVIVRRKTVDRQQRAAFVLGRESMRQLMR